MKKRKGQGRPRDESVDTRVVAATLELLAEEGLSALSVESIATTAGVSKSSVYRRWNSKEEIIIDAIATVAQAVNVSDTGDIRHDLVTAIDGLRGLVSDTRAGEVFPWLVSEIASRSDIGVLYFTTVVHPRRRAIVDLLAAARERGDIRSSLDVEIAVDILTGPVILRRMAGNMDSAPDDWVEIVVDSLLTGWLED
jgi:AcrR family transcriptional regulator